MKDVQYVVHSILLHVELFLALLSILQDFFICTHNFDEIVLLCYEDYNFGSRRKKKVST